MNRGPAVATASAPNVTILGPIDRWAGDSSFLSLVCEQEYQLLFVGSANYCRLFILQYGAQDLRIDTCQWVAIYVFSLQIIAAESLADKTAAESPSQ